jgi:hypothetical protein
LDGFCTTSRAVCNASTGGTCTPPPTGIVSTSAIVSLSPTVSSGANPTGSSRNGTGVQSNDISPPFQHRPLG